MNFLSRKNEHNTNKNPYYEIDRIR